MNPLTAFKLYRKVNEVLSLFQQASASYEKEGSMSKSMFQSRTFWVNVVGVSLEIAQLVSGLRVVPTVYMTLILGILNVVLRSLTDRPVYFVAPK